MTDSVTQPVRSAGDRTRSTVGGLKDAVASNPAADRLKQELQAYLATKAQHLAHTAAHKLGQTTGHLNDVAEGRAQPHQALLEGGRRLAEGQSPLRAAIGTGAQQLKERVKQAFRRGGGSGAPKVIHIMEDVDVGVPVRQAYNQWTRYQEFARFTKGVKSVENADETTTNWKAKIFVSERSWKASVSEQIPDQRIVWTSEGAKGTNKGVVTFHPLGDNLTRVLLVLEYYPKGLFEKTGNIWRAQGRRARLDLKHFRRYVSMQTDEIEGWRGEIRDGEVVRDHDEVVEEEEREREEREARASETEPEPEPEEQEAPDEDTGGAVGPDEDTSEAPGSDVEGEYEEPEGEEPYDEEAYAEDEYEEEEPYEEEEEEERRTAEPARR